MIVSTPAVQAARSACVSYLPAIEKASPGDGGALKVAVPGGSVRVTCFHDTDGNLIVKVSKLHVKHVSRHYHIVFDETQP